MNKFYEWNERILSGYGPGICMWVAFIGAFGVIIWWLVRLFSP